MGWTTPENAAALGIYNMAIEQPNETLEERLAKSRRIKDLFVKDLIGREVFMGRITEQGYVQFGFGSVNEPEALIESAEDDVVMIRPGGGNNSVAVAYDQIRSIISTDIRDADAA